MGSINDHREESIEPAFHKNRRQRSVEERVTALEDALRLMIETEGNAAARSERFLRMIEILNGTVSPGDKT